MKDDYEFMMLRSSLGIDTPFEGSIAVIRMKVGVKLFV